MSEAISLDDVVRIKIVGVPAQIPGASTEDDDTHLPRQEFHGLVLPSITPNGAQRGSYIVLLLDAWPEIDHHRPLLAEWFKKKIPQEQLASARLIFEAEVCREVTEGEAVTSFA